MGNVLKAVPGGGGELDDIDKEGFPHDAPYLILLAEGAIKWETTVKHLENPS